MAYEVLEVVNLPVHEEKEIHPGVKVNLPTGEGVRKEPGDKITKAEFLEHGQTDDDIKKLIKDKAIREAK
jgi:urease beta subunit